MISRAHNRCQAWLLRLLLLGTVLGLTQCTGSNPAAPPAPPTELPSALVLPNPTIDVSEIGSGSGSSKLAAFVVGAGPLGDSIRLGPDNIGDTNITFQAIVGPLQAFTIPVSTTTVFQREETLFGKSIEVKIDFSSFDFDGDGIAESCSGHTAALPVCMRMWVAGEQMMEAVFDHFPTDTNKGSGSMKFVVPNIAGGDKGVKVSVVYDHVDPINKTTDLSLFTPQESFTTSYRRALITEVGAEGSAKKTINFNKKFLFHPSNPDTIQYIGSFLQNNDFWSGSVVTSGPVVGDENQPTACAQISSGNEVLVGTCQDLGIDTTGTAFVDFATDANFAFFNFPVSPTF